MCIILMISASMIFDNGMLCLQVEVVSLNSKDIMLLLGRLDASGFEGGWSMDAIGLECAGFVAEVGNEAPPGLRVGDRVMAGPLMRHGSFQKYIEAHHYDVVR